MRRIFTEFCDNSTIHGIRYFSERRRHWSERLWWIVAFSLSLLSCGSSIQSIWIKWYEKPVTLSISEKELPISIIPFPTVTICPQIKFLRKKLDLPTAYRTWSQAPENLSDIEISRLRTLCHICQRNNIFAPPDEENKFTNNSIYEIIEDIAPSLEDITLNCDWKEEFYTCYDIFEPIFTDDGLCFTFNALNSNETYTEHMAPELMTVKKNPNILNWSPDGYGNRFKKREYPVRIFNAKQASALNMRMLFALEDIEYVCSGVFTGFKVTLTTPGEMRQSSTRYFNALLSEQMDIFIKPKMITTSKKLRRYKPWQRQCFFNTERQLRFFKIYTQNNCESECVANFTKIKCGCVKFSMPRDKFTKICGTGKVQCYRDAEKKLFGEDIIDEFKNDSVKFFRSKCNCLPACTSIKYDADIDRTKFDYMQILKSLDLLNTNLTSLQMSSLSVFFIEPQVATLRRIESQTYTDFFANCGGLLGLFLGVSVLSIIEFVYYSTLRLFWTIRRSRNENAVVPFERKVITTINLDSFNGRKAEQLQSYTFNP